MKHTLFLAAVLVSLGIFSQNVHIPDLKFKRALLANTAINTDSNPQEISVAEAQAFKGRIGVSNKQIQDLTGIEAFVNITTLACDRNQLENLDLSSNKKLEQVNCERNKLKTLVLGDNTNLKSLYCHSNKLESLNVSQNTSLTKLICGNNQLISLDVSKNTSLTELNCRINQLKSLDVSKNTELIKIHCYHNQLSSLDVSQNTSLTELICFSNQLTSLNLANGNNSGMHKMDTNYNSGLTCIQIDANFTPTTNWKKDATASWSTNCSLGVDDIELNSQEVSIYPNPVQDVLNVALAHSKVKSVVVYNVLGVEVLRSTSSSIAVQSLPSGIYIVKVEDIKGRKFANKIVKK